MKIFSCVVLAMALSWPAFGQESELQAMPGYIDFGALESVYGEPRVMINIGGALLKFMAAASRDDPEAAALMRDLKGVRVSVYPTDGKMGPALEQVVKVRKLLSGANWQPVVQVQETGEQVQIFMKSEGDVMQGLTVMAVDAEEAVFINILGSIDPEQMSKVMDKLSVDVDLE